MCANPIEMYGFVIVILHRCLRKVFSREPRLYKRVCPSVGPSVMLLSAGRDELANDLFRVYELVEQDSVLHQA